MREFWFGVFGSIIGVLAGAAIVVTAAGFLLSAILASLTDDMAASPAVSAADSLVLEIDLRGLEVDDDGGPPHLGDGSEAVSAVDIVRALELAANDPHMSGAILYIGGRAEIRAGHAEEIALAMRRLASTGRRVVGYVENADHAGLPGYLLAAGAAEVWASPLARLDANSARDMRFPPPETFTTARITLAARLRDRAPDAVAALYASGPVTAMAAQEAGLIDRLGSDHDARSRALGDSGPVLIGLGAYLARAAGGRSGENLALIAADGLIVSGRLRDAQHPPAAFAAALADAIDSAAGDNSVRAIVVRISSPGGDPSAADQIAAAIRRAQAAGKPVVASIGSVANSWAYHAIAPADRIVTPSLAAVGGLGSQSDQLPASLTQRTAGSDDRARNRVAEQRYLALLEGVSESRSLPLARVDALARGQLWTGAEAVELGLADEIGGLHKAAARARELAGVPGGETVVLTPYPAASSRIETALSRLGDWLSEP